MDIPILGLAGLIAMVWKVIDFVRLLANFQTQKSGILTQALSWTGGIIAVVVYANSDFADSVVIGGKNLDVVSGMTLVLIGLVLGSMASATVDLKQALDNGDNSAKPKLLK